jgi:ketosteroid isomerase-like protein
MLTLPERIIEFYNAINDGPSMLSRIDGLYADRVHYVDPIQEARGRAGVRRSFERLFAKYTVIIADVEAVGDERLVMATWTMVLKPKLGPTFRVRGACDLLAENGLIVRQRDYWDLLGTAMASLPWINPIYKRIVNLLFI